MVVASSCGAVLRLNTVVASVNLEIFRKHVGVTWPHHQPLIQHSEAGLERELEQPSTGCNQPK